MKRLTLIRHAKSSWKQSDLADFERPLNARGEREAPQMAERFARRGPAPDALLASPAARAAHTALAVARALGRGEADVAYDRRLYLAGRAALLDIVRQLDDALEHAAIVGHNPGITSLAVTLGAEDIRNVPTSGVVTLELDVESWRDAGERCGRVVDFDFPKLHRR